MLRTCVFFIALLASASWVMAEQKVDFKNHELHYIVLNTTEIQPEIAQQYGIVRSGKRAFINLSILQSTEDGYGIPVSADVSAQQRTLVGQIADIELQEIREGNAVYYIGTFQIINRETLWFDINLSVPNGPSFEYSFSQQVWQE